MNELTGDVSGVVIQANNITMPTIPMATAGLPAVAPGFVGRDDVLSEIATAWSTSPVVCVSGLAGIGKTSVLIRAAHDAADRFPGGALFIDLDGYDPQQRVEPAAALGVFLRALGVPAERIHGTADERGALFRSLLANRQPTILILDNASSARQVTPLLPGNALHRVGVSSRHRLSGVDGAYLIDVDVLPESDAVCLLGIPGATELAELCGRLPLALRIVGARIGGQPERSITEWVTELRDESNRLELLNDGDNRAVRTAFELSYRLLPKPQQRVFGLLGLYPGNDFAAPAIAALADRPVSRELGELRRAHLIAPATAPGHYRLHDLVRLYALELAELIDDREPAIRRLLGHYLASTLVSPAALRKVRDITRMLRIPEFYVGMIVSTLCSCWC